MIECPNDTQLWEIARGGLPAEQLVAIEHHLDRCASCQELVGDLAQARSLGEGSLRPGGPPCEPASSGGALNRRYVLLDPIGRGGMGEVFRALDRLTGGHVALKRMPLRLGLDIPAVSRLPGTSRTGGMLPSLQLHGKRLALANEFRTLASLRHPHIVSVLDYGFDAQREPYLTMELLAGAQPLLPFAAHAPREVQLHLLAQLLRALSYLHRRGVLHRDLKPSNILLQHTAEGVVLKVVDFGLALLRDEAQHERPAGTLRYMAPELLCGQPASEASDLYAVGVLAYQMHTGQHPFQDADAPRRFIAQAQRGEPDLTALPPALQAVIGRALRRAPGERGSDAAALLRALAEASGVPLSEEPIGVRDSFLIAARFTGRESEMQVLHQALGAARKGRGSLWLVGGEAGVGKSRLLEELRSRALTQGVLVARGQAVASGGATYQLFSDVLKLLALHHALGDLTLGVLGTVLPGLAVLLERAVPPPPELDAQGTRLRLLRVLGELLSGVTQPTLLLLEDLQWADGESLALLTQLAPLLGSRPLLIVGSYRDDEAPRLPAALAGADVLRLPRLAASEMRRLCESMLGPAAQGSRLLDLVALVARETEGNTYFIIEALRALADAAGSLAEIGRHGLPERLPSLGIEPLLEGRLGRAPAAVQPLLRLAAVAGRQLDLAVLARLWPGQLPSLLQASADAGVLEAHEQGWRFSHDKLRERLLVRMSPPERAALHGRVAEALEAVYAGDALPAAQVAHHFHQAGQQRKAARYYRWAGNEALRHGAAAEAVAALEQALALQDGDAARIEQVQTFRALALARYGLGQLRGVDAALEQVCALAGQPLPASPRSYARALLGQLGELLLRRARRLLPAPRAERPAASEPELPRELFEALTTSEVYIWLGQPLRLLVTSLWGMNLTDALQDRGTKRLAFRTGIAMLLSFTSLGGIALRYLERSEELFAEGAFWDVLLLRCKSLVALHEGRWAASLQHAEQAVALARAHKDDLSLLHALPQLLMALSDNDEFVRARAMSHELEHLAARAQNALYLAFAILVRGGGHLRVGELTEAAALLEQARAGGDPAELGPVLETILYGAAALCAVQQGQLAHAEAQADRALGVLRRTTWPLPQLRYAFVGMLSVYLTEAFPAPRPQATEALARLRSTARLFRVLRPAAHLYHGVACFRLGRFRRAARSLRRALRAATRLQQRFEHGWAHYWLGRLARTAAGPRLVPEGAATHYAAALATFERIGAAWDLAQVRAAVDGAARR